MFNDSTKMIDFTVISTLKMYSWTGLGFATQPRLVKAQFVIDELLVMGQNVALLDKQTLYMDLINYFELTRKMRTLFWVGEIQKEVEW